MAMYPFGSSIPDDDMLQDMEEYLYNPLPDGLIERDWLDLPDIQRDWLDLPDIQRDWLDLPDIQRDWLDLPTLEQDWLDTPNTQEQKSLEQAHNDTHDFDLEM